MLPPVQAQEALRRCLQDRLVTNLEPLLRVAGTRCRVTVFRRLRELGYRTSFTHSGRYYALAGTPRFDEHGLWFFRGIGFSQARELRETIVELVARSPAGLTFGELRRITTVRVENALSALVRQGSLRRSRVGRQSVYISSDEAIAARQVGQRDELLRAATSKAVPESLVLDVLLEVVRAGGIFVALKIVTARLIARGVTVNEGQVATVYTEYGLAPGKKTVKARRSKSWRGCER